MKLPSPDSLTDFMAMFDTEEACEDYLYALRWPEGFVCPKCESTRKPYWIRSQRKVECGDCGEQTYLTADTIFHKTHTPLKTWFLAAYLVTTHTPGISAVQLQRQLGLTRYETAFQILHKLRAAMVNPERQKLHGVVEVDETFIGGDVAKTHGGRSPTGKNIVVGAVEQRHNKSLREARRGRTTVAGRVRMRVIPDTTAKSLVPFVQDHVEPDSVVLTDAWNGYARLGSKGFQHEPIVNAALKLIHLEFSNLKTWLQGTHHGRVEEQHLQAYVNEFCFRHNRRFWPFTAFQTVLRIGMHQEPQEYEELYEAEGQGEGVHVRGFEEYDP